MEERSDSVPASTGPDDPHEGTTEGEGPAKVSVEQVYFPPEVARFLTELSRAVQKHAMYPPAHPALRLAVARAHGALEPLLDSRAQIVLGIGRRRIAVADAETDPGNPLFSGLAEHFHEQELASVTFRTGISEEELADFLARVAVDPRRSGRPLGKRAVAEGAPWRHILLQPVRYERLGLAWSRSGRSSGEEKRRADELWLMLAASMLPDLAGEARTATSEEAAGPAKSGDGRAAAVADVAAAGADPDAVQTAAASGPEELAAALERAVEDEGFGRKAFDGLATVSRGLKGLAGDHGRGLQWRISRFVSVADREALRSVLATGAEGERHDLIRDAAHWMDPAVVVELIRSTAAIEGRELSNPLLLLMAKMARYASSEAPDLAPEAEANLRDQVTRLLADWDREYDVPEPYREALREMAFAEPEAVAVETRQPTVGAEPEHVLRVGLLVDKAGPHVWNSATTLMQGRRFRELTDALDVASAGAVAAEELWGELATPKAVAWILLPHPQEEGPDLDVLDRFVARLGPRAAPPLLDRLAHSDSPELRRELFLRLQSLGPAIAPHLLERLEDGRWWVRRNAVALLRRVRGWPATWSPHELMRDSHPEVRTEALALTLRFRDQRDWAICELLAQGGPRARELGLRAAQDGAPPEAVPLLLDVLEDQDAELEHRVLALRALAALRPPELPERVIEVAASRRGGLFRLLGPFRPVKLEPRSPLTLEALADLARGWKDHPEAAAVLRKARKSEDEVVKAASYGKLIGGSVKAPPVESPPPPEYVPGPEDAR